MSLVDCQWARDDNKIFRLPVKHEQYRSRTGLSLPTTRFVYFTVTIFALRFIDVSVLKQKKTIAVCQMFFLFFFSPRYGQWLRQINKPYLITDQSLVSK